MKTILIAILAVLSVALAGVLGYQKLTEPDGNLAVPKTCPRVVNQPEPVRRQLTVQHQDTIDEWKTYAVKENGFEIKYPKEWFVQVEEGCKNLCGCHVRIKSQNFPIEYCGVPSGGMFDCWPNETPSGAIFDIYTSCTPDDSAYQNFTDSMRYRETFKIGGVAMATIGDDAVVNSYLNPTFASNQAYNFFHNGLQYTIRTMVYLKPDTSELEAEALGNNFLYIFYQMFTTFKFIK